jgi:hypothetical protein
MLIRLLRLVIRPYKYKSRQYMFKTPYLHASDDVPLQKYTQNNGIHAVQLTQINTTVLLNMKEWCFCRISR